MKSLAECIGCGCTDRRACPGGCSWLKVDYSTGFGVCSNCPEFVAAWDAGEYYMHVEEPADAPPGLLLPEDPEFDATLHELRRR